MGGLSWAEIIFMILIAIVIIGGFLIFLRRIE